MRIQQNNAVQQQAAAQAENGGGREVVSYDDPRLNPNDNDTFEQLGKDKETFYAEMKPGAQNNARVWFSAYGVKAQKLGYSPVELGLNEADMNALRFICNVYHAPSQLLNDPAAKTFNTVTEAEKALIIRCVLPLLCNRRDSVNWMYNQQNLVVDFDLTVYDQLQPDKVRIAEWVNKMPLTNQRKLEIAGEDVPDTMSQEMRDAIFIQTGLQNAEDLLAPAEDNFGENDNNVLSSGGNNPYTEDEP
jgi:hypothetical protein